MFPAWTAVSNTMSLYRTDGGNAVKLKSALRALRKNSKGLTLIELTVTISIAAIIMGSIVTIVVIMYKSFDSDGNNVQAQNLCVMTMQKITDTLRYADTVTISDIESGNGIYYDKSADGIHMGNDVFLAGGFKGYAVDFKFSKEKDNLLAISMCVKSKNGKTKYYTLTSKVYLMNGKIENEGTGNSSVQYTANITQ